MAIFNSYVELTKGSSTYENAGSSLDVPLNLKAARPQIPSPWLRHWHWPARSRSPGQPVNGQQPWESYMMGQDHGWCPSKLCHHSGGHMVDVVSGWWFEPLWKILVSHSQLEWLFPIICMGKYDMFQTTNQFSVGLCNFGKPCIDGGPWSPWSCLGWPLTNPPRARRADQNSLGPELGFPEGNWPQTVQCGALVW